MSTVIARPRRRNLARFALSAGVVYLGCAAIALIAVGPFLWMLSTSFKLPGDVITMPPEPLPNPATSQNYQTLINSPILPFRTFVGNSTYIAILVIIGRLAVCALAAYGFARLRFRGRDLAFGMLLGCLMIPDMLMILPLYATYVQVGLINTHFPLIVPPILSNTFGTFLLRQFFLTIPREYEEAALVDGASHIRIFLSIMLPLAKPALATLAILTFVSSWNDFFNPLIYLSDVSKFTLPVGLAFFVNEAGADYGPLMAGATLSIIPTVVLFVLTQRQFTRGIAMTGLKS